MARDAVLAMQAEPSPDARSGDLADDPGLAPGLMTAQATATAPPAPAPGSPESRSQEFVPVEGGQESVDAGTLLVAAYVVMWAIALVFVALSWMRQRRLDTRIAELESALGRRDPDAPAPRSPER